MHTIISAEGEKLKSCKSLASAQKIAEKENAIVIHNGTQVFPATITPYEVLVRINIRTEPSLDALKIGAADKGTILDAFEDLGDWIRIRWNGKEAYARHKGFEYIRRA